MKKYLHLCHEAAIFSENNISLKIYYYYSVIK